MFSGPHEMVEHVMLLAPTHSLNETSQVLKKRQMEGGREGGRIHAGEEKRRGEGWRDRRRDGGREGGKETGGKERERGYNDNVHSRIVA